MPSLQLIEGMGIARVWTFSSVATLIGRDSRQCHVVLADDSVSRVHAEVKRTEDTYYMVDQASRAGTWLNRRQLEANVPHRLRSADKLEIGGCQLVFWMDLPDRTEELASDSVGSVTHWIHDLQGESADLAQKQLWNRYFVRLVGLARARLGNTPRGAEDEEDVAIRALSVFFERAGQGRFPSLSDRHGLWQLLSTIVVRQAINQRHNVYARKRGGGRVRTGSVAGERETSGGGGMAEAIGTEPTPEFLAEMAEQCSRLMASLPLELRHIARRKLEGYTHAQIAAEIGKVTRTVDRKLQEIRRIWSARLD